MTRWAFGWGVFGGLVELALDWMSLYILVFAVNMFARATIKT